MKFLGILFLSLVPIVFSFRMGDELRRKDKERKSFCSLLSYMHFQIENFLSSQEEIFSRFEDTILQNTAFFTLLQERLRENPGGAFGFAWKEHGADFSFDGESREILDRLADHFGLVERSAQLNELSRAITFLEQKKNERKAECENKIKILRISGLTAGLGILILLI